MVDSGFGGGRKQEVADIDGSEPGRPYLNPKFLSAK